MSEITRIDEATAEGVDVINIAQYVANFLSKHAKYGRGYDIQHMEEKSQLPELNTDEAYSMLYDHGLTFAILKGKKIDKRSRMLGAYLRDRRLIWVDQRALLRFGQMTSILAHEIQHALDDIRSGGKALPSFDPDYTRDEYLARPQEINARFAQAMHDIVDQQAVYIEKNGQPWDRRETMQMISKILDKNDLRRKVFPAGPRGDKAYNRIISRAHTFNGDVRGFIRISSKLDKPSMVDKIKTLIRSYLPI